VRARPPDRAGHVVRDGVRIYYEAYGDGAGRPIVFTPADTIRRAVGGPLAPEPYLAYLREKASAQ